MKAEVRDTSLAPYGKKRIEWAEKQMPVLAQIKRRFEATRPLAGLRIGACLHVTSETANLMRTLKAGGAEVYLCASNPLSTQDDTAASLARDYGVNVFAIRGVDESGYYRHIEEVIAARPQLTMDDGCDLVTTIHRLHRELLPEIKAGTEETTTGVIRLRAMHDKGDLGYPVIGVNEAATKRLFDNRYGTGQSALDGVIRATNVLLAGRTLVVLGYGMCGRGVASRARGMGAQVIVCEVEATRALEAAMDGFRVMRSLEAATHGDIFLTVTGDKHVLRKEHFEVMKDGAILANAGHFDIEIDLKSLRELALEVKEPRRNVQEYVLASNRSLFVLAEGRLVNLGAAEGHPAQVMDMSFANQALSLEWLAGSAEKLGSAVYPVPEEIDHEVARLKLETMGIAIDQLTPDQVRYLSEWQEGT